MSARDDPPRRRAERRDDEGRRDEARRHDEEVRHGASGWTDRGERGDGVGGERGGGERGAGDEGDPMADKDKPLYVISVAAELVDMHPQTLRLYERKGLIEPSRSAGKTRLYSQRNIEQLRDIRRLTQELGVNLAGVEEIIRLRRDLDELQQRMERRIGTLQDRIQSEMASMRHALPAPRDEDEDDDATAAAEAEALAALLKRREQD
jgi:MerR family transcriptional regulator, heat shock protein HspR